MKRPNFFIIGAPKCGTTSLARWLGSHPRIYMSPLKEPNFFNTDDRARVVRSLSEYEALFRDAGEEHLAVGEASAWYLYSREAVPNILRYNPEARFIVMVRNPIEMAYSLHQQELFSGNETVEDFERAWALQFERARGRQIPRFCKEPKRLLYGPACKLGEQLERLYRTVPKEKVLVLVLDDVKENPRREYLKVLAFLNVPDDGRRTFPVYNPAKARRFRPLGRVIGMVGRRLGRWKRALGIQGGLGLLNALDRLNTVPAPRPPLSEDMWQTLVSYFEDDIQRLSQLLDRDFSSWLHPPKREGEAEHD